MRNDGLDLKMWNLKFEIIDNKKFFLHADKFSKSNQFH